MTSRSQRFGPRIGGWRDRSSTVVTEQRFTHADIAATPYLAVWRAPNGVSTQWMVLALDEDDAKTCAKLRAAHLGYDTKGCYVDLLPMPRASEATYRAILDVECTDEYALRNKGRER